MRVVKTHETPNRFRLVLASNHWLYTAFGALFMAAGAAVMWMMTYEVVLVVEDGAFLFTRRFIGLITVEEVILAASEVRSVTIELITALSGLVRSYEVTITGPNGIWRPWLVMADGDTKRAIAVGVQQALADHSRQYEYSENGSLPGLALGATLILAGLYVLAFIQVIEIVGNRQQGNVVITRRRLLLLGGVQRTLAIADIVRCKPKASSFHTARGHRVTSYQVVLQVRDHEDHDEDVSLSFGPAFTHKEANVLARTINRWLVKAR